MTKVAPTHLHGPFVKHLGADEAIVTAGPMLDAKGEKWICRIRLCRPDENEIWVFADDLEDHQRVPVKER